MLSKNYKDTNKKRIDNYTDEQKAVLEKMLRRMFTSDNNEYRKLKNKLPMIRERCGKFLVKGEL
jgi:hypothetical protein